MTAGGQLEKAESELMARTQIFRMINGMDNAASAAFLSLLKEAYVLGRETSRKSHDDSFRKVLDDEIRKYR